MNRRRGYLFVFTLSLASMFFAGIVCAGQDKEKPQTGSAVDTWRKSLPPEAEAQKLGEEVEGATLPLTSTDEVHKTLLSLERGWVEAVKGGDADSLSQLISGDFAFVSPRAMHVTDRNQYMEHSIRDLKVSSLELDKITVRLFGRTAIVDGLLKQKATVKGEDVGGTYLFTDVWINRGGTWRVVSRHESLLPQPK